MKLDDLIRRSQELLSLAEKVKRTGHNTQYGGATVYVDEALFAQFRTSSLSFLINVFGSHSPFARQFEQEVRVAEDDNMQTAVGILHGAHDELVGGWLATTKGLVSAEIFSDFLEMAEHLLSEHYKDAAAVMVGSVLEEHLRQLCKAAIDLTYVNPKGDTVPKKADTLNSELAKQKVYNALDQKQVTAWLGLRNEAAHGHCDKYTEEQVRNMLEGVTNFMTRVSP